MEVPHGPDTRLEDAQVQEVEVLVRPAVDLSVDGLGDGLLALFVVRAPFDRLHHGVPADRRPAQRIEHPETRRLRATETEPDVLGHVAFEVQDKDRLSLGWEAPCSTARPATWSYQSPWGNDQGLLELGDLGRHEVGRGTPVVIEAADAEPSLQVFGCACRPVGRLDEKPRALEFRQVRRAREIHEIEGIRLIQDVACPQACSPHRRKPTRNTVAAAPKSTVVLHQTCPKGDRVEGRSNWGRR